MKNKVLEYEKLLKPDFKKGDVFIFKNKKYKINEVKNTLGDHQILDISKVKQNP